MNNARIWLAFAGETMLPPRTPFFSDAGNLPVPRTPPRLTRRPEVAA
jgi:hypothetical protein